MKLDTFDDRVTDLMHKCDDYPSARREPLEWLKKYADQQFPDPAEIPDVIHALRPRLRSLSDGLRDDPNWAVGRSKLKRLQTLIAHLEDRVATRKV